MSLLRTIFRRRAGKSPQAGVGGTFVMEAEWERSEELRTDRLGPSQDDVENPERVRVERWRPRRTLD
jgi:hypothetical protein